MNHEQHDATQGSQQLVKMIWIVSANEMLKRGLSFVEKENRRRYKARATLPKVDRRFDVFKAHYGSNPRVYSILWEYLQRSELEEVKIDVPENEKERDKLIKYFFVTLYYVKSYPTEEVGAAAFAFGVSVRTFRRLVDFLLGKISALMVEQVSDNHCVTRKCLHYSPHFL